MPKREPTEESPAELWKAATMKEDEAFELKKRAAKLALERAAWRGSVAAELLGIPLTSLLRFLRGKRGAVQLGAEYDRRHPVGRPPGPTRAK